MRLLILTLLYLLSHAIMAQVTLTNRILPAVGDIYTYHVDSLYNDKRIITAPGPGQNWDLSSVIQRAVRRDMIVDPSTSRNFALFPNANAVVRSQGRESFVRITTNKIEEHGFANGGQGGPNPFTQPTVYNKPVIIFSTPADYQEGLNYQTESAFSFPASFIPDSILNQFPGGFKPDSFRVKTKTDIDKLYDAWGKISLPMKTWDVLREKRTTKTAVSVEAKLGFLGWQDITALAAPFFGVPSLSGTGISYFFYSNQSKGFIAGINTDSLGNVTGAIYNPTQSEVSTSDYLLSNKIKIKNPITNADLELHIADISSGEYGISIIASTGQILQHHKLELLENTTLHIPINHYASGNYLLIVHGPSGEFMYSAFLIP